MDVTLPDGTIIRNVPEGTTKEQLYAKLRASGYDMSKLTLSGPALAEQQQGQALRERVARQAATDDPLAPIGGGTGVGSGRYQPSEALPEGNSRIGPDGRRVVDQPKSLQQDIADRLGAGADFLMAPLRARNTGGDDPTSALARAVVEPTLRLPEALVRDPLKTIAQDYNPIYQMGMGYKDVEGAAASALQGDFGAAGTQALEGVTEMLGGGLGLVGVRSVMQNWLKSVPPNVLEAPPATLQDAEKILADFRVARELSDDQLAPVANAINAEMRKLQAQKVKLKTSGETIPYTNTSEGYERVMKLNGLLMNAFKDETGEIDIAKAMRWAEKNDPDRAMRVEAGRAVNDLQDGVRRNKPKPRSGPAGVKPPPVRNGLFGGNPEAIGAGAGAVFAPDVDGDGEVSFGERAGAAITGALGGRLFGGRGSGGQPSNVDAQGFGGGSVSMRSYAQATPDELDNWYKSEVEQVAKSSTKTTLRLKSSPETQEGTLRKLNDVHINFENDGVGLAVDMTFRGGHSAAKYTANPKDVAAATRVFAKSLAAINVYVRKNNPTYITFYGATPAHTKLYQKLMERANIQGYTPIKDVGSTSYMNKTPTGEVIGSVAPRLSERFMLIKDEELAKFKARRPNALTSFAYQSVGPDGAPIVAVSKSYADRTPIR